MVGQFPLDAMHLIDLGVAKTVVKIMMEKINGTPRDGKSIEAMADLYASFAQYCPSEISQDD